MLKCQHKVGEFIGLSIRKCGTQVYNVWLIGTLVMTITLGSMSVTLGNVTVTPGPVICVRPVPLVNVCVMCTYNAFE